MKELKAILAILAFLAYLVFFIRRYLHKRKRYKQMEESNLYNNSSEKVIFYAKRTGFLPKNPNPKDSILLPFLPTIIIIVAFFYINSWQADAQEIRAVLYGITFYFAILVLSYIYKIRKYKKYNDFAKKFLEDDLSVVVSKDGLQFSVGLLEEYHYSKVTNSFDKEFFIKWDEINSITETSLPVVLFSPLQAERYNSASIKCLCLKLKMKSRLRKVLGRRVFVNVCNIDDFTKLYYCIRQQSKGKTECKL